MTPKTYEAIYENGQVKWLNEQPPQKTARIIVTVVEEPETQVKYRSFPGSMAGQVEIVGDIVGSIVGKEEWQCLK